MLRGYIRTRNKPPICYLPAQHNTETTEALKRTVDKIEGRAHARVFVCMCRGYVLVFMCRCYKGASGRD